MVRSREGGRVKGEGEGERDEWGVGRYVRKGNTIQYDRRHRAQHKTAHARANTVAHVHAFPPPRTCKLLIFDAVCNWVWAIPASFLETSRWACLCSFANSNTPIFRRATSPGVTFPVPSRLYDIMSEASPACVSVRTDFASPSSTCEEEGEEEREEEGEMGGGRRLY